MMRINATAMRSLSTFAATAVCAISCSFSVLGAKKKPVADLTHPDTEKIEALLTSTTRDKNSTNSH